MTARINEARLRRLASRIHELGPRPLFELFREIDSGAQLVERLEVYADLPADFIRANGGDTLDAARLFAIRGGVGHE